MNPKKLIEDLVECLNELESEKCDSHDREMALSRFENRVLQLKDWVADEKQKPKEHHND